jgi:hypothetical protein
MSEKPAHRNGRDLWARVLEIVAHRVGLAAFETWFEPVVLAGWDETSCRLVVPNPSFRKCFLDNYSDLLKHSMHQLVDAPVALHVSIAEAEASKDQPPCLPVVHASALENEAEQKPWLIERLWTHQAVGIIGGPPKLLKTWVALEIAVSVASGSLCLGTFPVHQSGPVLLFAAEDSQAKVRSRLESLAHHHGFSLQQINLQVITADTLRLDRPSDQDRLAATILFHQPVLLVLDPLVRLHSLDENQSGPMAALLGYFRGLQRKTGTAIVIVHHARKNNSSSAGAGYTLRGSGDLYAWLDSLISVKRHKNRTALIAEHRSAPGLGPLHIELSPSSSPNQMPYLRLVSAAVEETSRPDSILQRILDLLEPSAEPLTTDSIRSSLQVRKQRVVDALHQLWEEGVIVRDGNKYALKKPN